MTDTKDENVTNELDEQKQSSIEEYQEEEAVADDTEESMGEEAVGTTVKSSAKKIAGSNPLVGQEIADNSYADSKTTSSDSDSSTKKTQSTTASSNTQTTSQTTSNVPTSTPSAYTADNSVSSNNNVTSTTKTRRFGVVTGDTTNIFPYALSGALAAMIAMLTAVTMRSRRKTVTMDDKDE